MGKGEVSCGKVSRFGGEGDGRVVYLNGTFSLPARPGRIGILALRIVVVVGNCVSQ